jgi:nucleotide-binding universal stress UspA family protein
MEQRALRKAACKVLAYSSQTCQRRKGSHMYRSILVPLDGSSLSTHALPIACDIARRSGAVLRLLHVHEWVTAAPIYVEGLPVIDESLRSLGKAHDLAYLEAIRDQLAAEYGVPIEVTVLDPTASDARDQTVATLLATHAAAAGTDLIVMTSHGRGGLARLWLGSVTDALVRASHVPILLLRPSEAMGAPDRARVFQRILIPLDGSARSEAIVAPALALGQSTQAEYTLLHIVAPFIVGVTPPFLAPRDFDPERTGRLQAEAQSYLDAVAELLRETGARVQTRVVVSEQTAAVILEEAGRHNSDLIAISTIGRSGLVRLLIGSVADKVLRGTALPLLLYRP